MKDKEIITKYNIAEGLPTTFPQVILVDCMDTILYRDLSLEAIVSLWAKQIGKEYNIYSNFLKNYRMEVISSAMHNTVPIDDIYGEIYDHCCHFGIINSINKIDFVENAHKKELELELKCQHLIPSTISFLKMAKANGAHIYCVSDFRLSNTDIMLFFANLGIDNIFSGVFSSSDVGKTKKEGSLYRHVLDCIQKESIECIMIGDNLQSDGVNASINGIKGHWLKRQSKSFFSLMKDMFIRLC